MLYTLSGITTIYIMEDLNSVVAGRLIRFRERSGLAQTELAKASGLSLSYVRKLERAESSPTIGKLQTYLSACGISLAHFFEPWHFKEEIRIRNRGIRRTVSAAIASEKKLPHLQQFLAMLDDVAD